MANPHDSLCRDTFGQAEHAAPLLQALLPPPLRDAIDWTSLRAVPGDQVDDQQRNLRLDQLFAVTFAGRPALLYVVFEHTSKPGRWVALQVLAYMVGVASLRGCPGARAGTSSSAHATAADAKTRIRRV